MLHMENIISIFRIGRYFFRPPLPPSPLLPDFVLPSRLEAGDAVVATPSLPAKNHVNMKHLANT